ncbi:phosphate ABC transporter substrate-binding protein PstS [Streptomyces sp. PTM05]|uniref:Phosphate-binding protein n=1 Tax=Streptantibioticus parmotrematis TaxID=2873249 RepID=A0ABS7QPF8_9ACTN|nr:phosphate ABC transporter substrate-binding protein PstS [Streptantibioticus parmotrematis]MBY8885066.1 phosphate ABC transporter substrate-binding protein PstS [Streptantibioticus parmotrematis]
MKLQRKSGLRALAVGAAAVSGALVLTACGSDNNSGSSSPSTGASNAAAGSIKCGSKGNLLASGSTAQQNAVNVWVKNYMQACPGTQINYKGTGSGAGVTEFLQGSTAFAGSDSALKPDQIAQSKKVCGGTGQAIDLPMVGGPIAVGYNLPGVSNLVLDAPTLAKIFNGKIVKWNDPAIAKLNPSAKLPSTAIQAFHRSDESGTTDNFTKYLIGAAGSEWPYSGGKAWQAKGGQSAQGSSGVAAQVKQTAGSIGYFELSYATAGSIPTVAVDTGASQPVQASSDNASKMIADAKVVGTGDDLSLKLDYATKADGAYPITLVTYEIVCDKGNKSATLGATKGFLSYIAGSGQQGLSGQGYAPIPAEINAKVRSTIDALS